jgi:hypothetical protein
MRRLRKFLLLPGAERGLLLKALLLLWVIRVGLWVVPFRVLRDRLYRLSDAPAEVRRDDAESGPSPERIGWAVAAASRYVPRATCLVQALAGRLLLERQGHPASLRIGVARDDERGRFEAHAWLECRGRVVLGGARHDRYQPLVAGNPPLFCKGEGR